MNRKKIKHSFIAAIKLLLLSAVTSCVSTAPPPALEHKAEWEYLFNGKDLSGWSTYLGKKGGDNQSLPIEEIFTVTDNTIHVYASATEGSPQYNATIVSDNKYANYHLQLEYKWGEKRFAPRAEAIRDAGVLFHCHSDLSVVWPSSVEMQIGAGVPGDPYVSGDLWVLGKTLAKASSMGYDPRQKRAFWKRDAEPIIFGDGSPNRRSNRTTEAMERERGEWNYIDIVVRKNKSALFYLNGKLVNQIYDMSYKNQVDQILPLTDGNIALQAEWAEIYYRNIKIKQL